MPPPAIEVSASSEGGVTIPQPYQRVASRVLGEEFRVEHHAGQCVVDLVAKAERELLHRFGSARLGAEALASEGEQRDDREKHRERGSLERAGIADVELASTASRGACRSRSANASSS